MTVNVDSEVEKRFRKAVLQEKGKGKGKLKEAVTEAFELWISKVKNKQIAENK